ncbi:MAG: sodium/proton-translocating pyrophosphatase, partial [Clostridia bacterium]|nr:sodium/proton-translocating pyrophosphatase [Clostridia bacterium]
MVAWFIVVLAVILLSIAYVVYNYINIKKLGEGTPEMAELAGIIRSGARVFIRTEFRTVAIVVVLVALVFSLFVEKTSGITFVLGALMSSIVCILGMRSATYANVRTANKAMESRSIGETVKVALCGGSISGLSVQAFGMLGFVLVMLVQGKIDPNAQGGGFLTTIEGINPFVMRVSTYSLGCSLVAMFNRVAGGNYTKAADISSDILAKLRHDMPEDDSRVPNVIADFIGDNVNDIAGNCSDLLESFVATMSAGVMLAISLYNSFASKVAEAAAKVTEVAADVAGAATATASEATAAAPEVAAASNKVIEVTTKLFEASYIFPVLLAGLGLLGCLLGLGYAAYRKMGDNPSKELNLATWVSAGITVVLGFFAALILFGNKDFKLYEEISVFKDFKWGWISPWISAVLGIASGVLIGIITEYYTSTDYAPTRKLAEIATEGEAFVITKGDAIGSRSCLLPIVLIGVALLLSGFVCGTYGIAISSLGMLAFVGATVSIDAFGPIADNAGGIAEACHLEPEVRKITDKLDAVGNTTAAI